MPSDQTERKKKRKKAKKPKKNQNLNSYVRISGDEEEAFVPSAEDGIESKPKPVVPYPEAEDAPQLTVNGNSLPNTPRHHKRPTGVGANGARLCNTCAARTCGWCSYNRLVWILVSSVFCIFLFIAGASYEDHHLRNTDPPVVHDGNAEQDTSKGTNDDVPSGGFGSDPSTYSQRQRRLMTKMRQLSGSVVSTPNTPQNKAANWILWEDATGISADSAFLWQRYVTALFYYKMGDDNKYFKLNKDTFECTWERIGCDSNGNIQHIRFDHCDLTGPIPTQEIMVLSELQYLDLSGNDLTGGIPSRFMELEKLQTLLLDGNDLVGVMPTEICENRFSGVLSALTSDCSGESKKVTCECCTSCGVGNAGGDKSDDEPQKSRQFKVIEKLTNLSGADLVGDESMPQYKATEWIAKEDDMELSADSPHLYQRYVLALLYFMMDGEKCFDILSGEDECVWVSTAANGVVWDRIACDSSGHLKYLKLDGCNLKGPIPLEIQALPYIDYLDLSNNWLTGQIPSQFQNLHDLVHLYLEDNKLTGIVPQQICQRTETGQLLSLTTDCGFAHSSLVQCDCCGPECSSHGNGNGVGGDDLVQFDERELAIMEKLRGLSGGAVDEDDTPQNRAALWIMKADSKKLNAESPHLYQRYIMTLLREIGDDNCFERESGVDECHWMSEGVGGMVWERIACDSKGDVEYLKLDNCNMSGPIPSELKELTSLNYIDLSGNRFSGNIPFELESLHNLGHMYLEKNMLIGQMPEQICDLRNNYKLLKLTADCDLESAEIMCDCCTNCESSNPGFDSRQSAVLEKLKMLSSEKISQSGSPQQRAADWIINDDAMALTASDDRLYQRYVLAILYFMMGNEKWFSLNGKTRECMWERIGCNSEEEIVHIKFDHCDIQGTIPPEIKILQELEFLDLSHNELVGEVPDELANLGNLEKLYLEGNDLSGAVPNDLCKRRDEGFLLVATTDCDKVQCPCCDNCDSDSPNPPSSGDNKGTEELRREFIREKINDLSPNLAETAQSPQNEAMHWLMDDDKLHLSIESPHFTQRYVIAVIYFTLGGNNWKDAFWKLTGDQHECEYTGIECNDAKRVVMMDFSGQGMDGSLPVELKYLFELMYLDFSNNNISGKIPVDWSSLSKLELLDVTGTKISGPIPPPICSLRLDAMITFEVECELVECSCCTNCSGATIASAKEERMKQISFKPELILSKSRRDALEWMLTDTFEVELESNKFKERYILALFYFSFNGDDWFSSVNGPEQWLRPDSHCGWRGVTCDTHGNVIALNLPSNNLQGSLPYEIAAIEYLRVIDLHSNKISGEIPHELGRNDLLNALILYSNEITDLTEDICDLRYEGELTVLWLDCEISCPESCCTQCGPN